MPKELSRKTKPQKIKADKKPTEVKPPAPPEPPRNYTFEIDTAWKDRLEEKRAVLMERITKLRANLPPEELIAEPQ